MSMFRRSNRWVRSGNQRRKSPRGQFKRRFAAEQLESRQLLSVSPWQNPVDRHDVNGDTSVSPIDALLAINFMNQRGMGPIAALLASSPVAEAGGATESFAGMIDVNGDGEATPADPLDLINRLNAEAEGAGTMTYILRTFNEAGTAQVSTVGLGQKFLLRAFVKDNRNLGNDGNGDPRDGVFSAYLDVKYTAALTSVSGTTVHNNVDFGNGKLGNTATAGILDGVGSFSKSGSPTGPAEFLLWSIPFTANATTAGQVVFTAESTTDPTDPGDQGQSPARDTTLFGTVANGGGTICPSSAAGGCTGMQGFMGTTLTIVSDPGAIGDTLTVAEDTTTATVVSVLGNDTTASPPLKITAVTQGNNGGQVVNGSTNVTYKPAANFAGTETFTYTIANSANPVASATGTVTVTVTPINDAPVVNVPATQSVPEDTVITADATNKITVSDPDGDVALQVTLTAANGKFAATTTAGVTITGQNSGNVQLSGIASAINTALSTGTYTPNQDFNGQELIVVKADDQGNTGGGALTNTKTLTINFTPINDPPVNATRGNLSTDEDVSLTLSTANNNSLSVSDADIGTSPLSLALSVDQGGTLNLTSTTGLTVTGANTKALAISGPIAAVNAALGAGLTFKPDASFIGTAVFTMRSDDQGATGGAARQDTDTFNIDVVPTVRPKALNDTATVDEDSTAGVTVAVLQNDRPNTGAQATLLSFTQPAAGGVVTLVDNGTPAVNTDDSLKFVPTANFAGTASFTYTINDTLPAGDPKKGADSTATVNITVTAINDGPTNTIPGAQTTNEDEAKAITGISVADIDLGAGNIEVTLTATNGTVGVTAGGATVANNNTASVNVTGTLAAVNAAIGSASYTPTLNFNGSATLTVATSDLGNTGTPGALTDTDTVTITVTAVNDAPVNSVPGKQTAIKDLDHSVAPAISIADVDAGSSNVQVTLAVASGRLTLTNTAGATVTTNGTASVGVSGTVTAINAVLAGGLTYRNNVGFTGNDTLTVTTNDQGNTGTGGAKTDVDTVTIEVLDFVPSRVGGTVFVDGNDNGARDAGELGLGGVVVTLSGTDFRGVAVSETRTTDKTGVFLFDNLKPSNANGYTLQEVQPAGMRAGKNRFTAPTTAQGDVRSDSAKVSIPIAGGVNSLDNLFGEIGLREHFARASDLLASSGDPSQFSGVTFGIGANNATWATTRGDTWADYDNLAVTNILVSADGKYATVTLSARNTRTNTTRTVTINSAVNARLVYIQDAGERVLRFKGRPDDLFAMGSGEGEAAATPNVPELSGEQYREAVEQVMAVYA